MKPLLEILKEKIELGDNAISTMSPLKQKTGRAVIFGASVFVAVFAVKLFFGHNVEYSLITASVPAVVFALIGFCIKPKDQSQ